MGLPFRSYARRINPLALTGGNKESESEKELESVGWCMQTKSQRATSDKALGFFLTYTTNRRTHTQSQKVSEQTLKIHSTKATIRRTHLYIHVRCSDAERLLVSICDEIYCCPRREKEREKILFEKTFRSSSDALATDNNTSLYYYVLDEYSLAGL